MRASLLGLVAAASFVAVMTAASANTSLSTSADSAQAPATSPAASQTAASDSNHVTCRSEKLTGTMLGGPRICHTQKEWDDMREQSQRNLEMNQNKGFEAGVPGG